MNIEHNMSIETSHWYCAVNLTASFHPKVMLKNYIQSQNSIVIASLTRLDCFQKNKYKMLKEKSEEFFDKLQEKVQ